MANLKSKQVAAVTGSYTPVSPTGTLDDSLIITTTEDLWVSVGHATPNDNTSLLLLANSSLTLQPAPIGLVAIKSATAASTVYCVSS